MEHLISVKTFENGVMSVSEFKNANLHKKEVAGIVLQTETIGLILALPSWKEKWGSEDICVDVKEDDDYIGEAKALTTLCGLEATKRIVAVHQDYKGMYAAKRCLEYDCADLQWHLPSLYELGMLAVFKNEINVVLDELGLSDVKLKDEWNWSSSEYTQTAAWGANISNDSFTYGSKHYSRVVRAVCAFEPLRGVLSTPSENEELTDDALITLLRQRGYKGEITKTFKL